MRFAAVAQEVVAALAPEGAVVLGNSVGGFAAARIAITAPELVKGLVIVDGGGFEGRSPQNRLFCGLMGRQWFLRRIYPSFSARYMRVRTAADRRARESAISTIGRPDGLKAVSELWASFAAEEHDLRGLRSPDQRADACALGPSRPGPSAEGRPADPARDPEREPGRVRQRACPVHD